MQERDLKIRPQFNRNLLSQMVGDPTFLSRDTFYLQLSLYCVKMNKKSMWEVLKSFKFSVHETVTLNLAVLRLQGAGHYGR